MVDDVEQQLWVVAQGQHGAFTREQARDAGASDGVIRRRLATGRWVRAGHRTFLVAGVPRSWRQALHVSVLDAGPDALATGRAAASLWGFPGWERGPIEILVARGRHHRPANGTLRETRLLLDHHVAVRHGIPAVDPARLVVELIAREHPGRVERTLDAALAEGLTTPERFALVVAELAHRGRRGAPVLREMVDERLQGYVPPASELEARFADVMAAAGLGGGVRQRDVGGDTWVGRVDVCYPHARLIVELDSRRWHDGHLAREDDRRRDNRLVAAGWRVVRITWRELLDDPAGVVALMRSLLVHAAAA